MRKLLAAMLAITFLVAADAAQAAKRVALVIGNDDYQSGLKDLANARKDARDMARTLTQLGFEVVLRTDVTRIDFGRALGEFEGKLSGAEVALVFYAGHGIESRGRNYLVPSDAQLKSEVDLRYAAVDANDIMETMERAGVDLSIVILDACRDNPLANRSGARGLAVPTLPAGIKGSAIIYSAAPGETAADGPPGGNGIFTGEFIQVIKTPGLSLNQVMNETTKRVRAKTQNRQRPFVNLSTTGEFFFNGSTVGATKNGAGTGTGAGSGTNAASLELAFWNSIKDSTDPAMFTAYKQQYPDGSFAPLADLKIKQLQSQKTAALSAPKAAPAPAPKAEPTVQISALDEVRFALKTSNVRAQPDAASAKVGQFKVGEKVDVTGKTRSGGVDWYRVAIQGRSAWVYGPLLGAEKPKATPAVGVFNKRAGSVFKDCTDCPELVVIPPGSFRMGDFNGGGYKDEKPVRTVNIRYSFAVGKYEVTQAEY